jgi:UDP-N-acetylglucosamine acyltransferase
MARIHPTAIVDPKAELAADVEVGPFAVIGPKVQIGARTSIGAHALIDGRTRIGRDNRIFPFCAIGGIPQDKKYAGEDTALEIGDGNTIREYCTLNTGTVQDAGVTRVGSGNWIMAYVHVAHDCRIGDHAIFANGVQLAGHVHVGDWAILGGLTGVHQFVRIGAHAMTGAGTTLLQDLPPFVICNGNPAAPHGINVEGLKRRGFDAASIGALRRAYKAIYKEGRTVADACAAIEALASAEPGAAAHLQALRGFVQDSSRGIVR